MTSREAVEAVWRIESARLIGGLARMVRDVGVAEDLAQDALVAALETWPRTGVPDNPGAWLMATAKHRAIDLMRRAKRLETKQQELALQLAMTHAEHFGEELGDDVLALMFTCCHPAVGLDARVALTLRALGGLTTPAIARAFLVPESTVAQRIVRAKRTLADEQVRFEVPCDLQPRLGSVLEVVYLIFNEGYTASAGEDWMRPALCEDALRLGRILARLAPAASEAHGLVALMELQASRLHARVDRAGNPILLLDQDRRRWDQLLIHRGLDALRRAERLGLGPYGLQAAIAACHARARRPEDTDWYRITAFYEQLARLSPSPVVELNRAVAIGMAFGPQAALGHVDRLLEVPELRAYHLLPSVRADLLAKLGRTEEARTELERAAALTGNAKEQALLRARAAAL